MTAAPSNPYIREPLPDFGAPHDFVVFGPHPDDIEHTIGGALIKWADAGKRILYCHLTSGEAGTYGSAGLRRQEAEAAAQLGKADVIFLDFPDTDIRDDRPGREALIRVIRAYKPKIIFAPYYHFPLMHPDHEAAGNIARAAFRMARFKGIDTGQPPHWTRYLFHYLFPADIRPSFVVDTSDVFDRWERMAECYGSQINNIPNYRNRILALKKTHIPRHPDATYLESFYCDEPIDAKDFDLIRVS